VPAFARAASVLLAVLPLLPWPVHTWASAFLHVAGVGRPALLLPCIAGVRAALLAFALALDRLLCCFRVLFALPWPVRTVFAVGRALSFLAFALASRAVLR